MHLFFLICVTYNLVIFCKQNLFFPSLNPMSSWDIKNNRKVLLPWVMIMQLISSLKVHHYNNIMCLPNLKFGLPSSQSPGHYSESCRNSWNTFRGFNVWGWVIIVNVFLPQQKMRKNICWPLNQSVSKCHKFLIFCLFGNFWVMNVGCGANQITSNL